MLFNVAEERVGVLDLRLHLSRLERLFGLWWGIDRQGMFFSEGA